MRELREDTFSGNKNDDAHEHVERVLDIVSLFNIPGVTHDAVMLHFFPITLTRAIKRLLNSLKKSITSSRTVMKHCIRLGKFTMTCLINAQLMTSMAIESNPDEANHSQKWYDGTSSSNIESNSNTEGIAAIISKLDSLCRDMKKLKENVHAIHVRCQLCRGAHLDKECSLNKEVKSVKEVKYGEFGCSYPFSNGAKYQTQIEELTKEFHAKTASEVPNSLVGQCKAVYANDEAPVENTSSNETNEVSFLANNEAHVA
ncbi:hypothetical protein Tco_0025601 [Tanacetum coccineum]